MEKVSTDCIVLGGGVSGLSISRKLGKSFKNIFLIEKNNFIAEESSSRNSEVIHAGIYYDKNSLKSELCLKGKELLYRYLRKKNIQFSQCGKFILSTSKDESHFLEEILNNATECGLNDLSFKSEYLRKLYPFLNFDQAIFSPSSGIFDSHSYLNCLKSDFEQEGGHVLLNNQCMAINYESNSIKLLIKDKSNEEEFLIYTKLLINCAGLESLDIYKQLSDEMGDGKSFKKRYVKGDYFIYRGKEKIEHLIYPIPNKESLGIHVTQDLTGTIKFGPNAYPVNNIDYSISPKSKNEFVKSIKDWRSHNKPWTP